MDARIIMLPLTHQWFIYALADQDIMLPDTAEEIIDDLGANAGEFEAFAQAAFDIYTASFSLEDKKEALATLQQLVEWAANQAAAGGEPDFSAVDQEPPPPSNAEIARALDELRR